MGAIKGGASRGKAGPAGERGKGLQVVGRLALPSIRMVGLAAVGIIAMVVLFILAF